ncbi:F-box/FBD/LRR-repeat protein At1g13570-like [Diospyros lotus]|uniref:F-box/FBD/LRR-repeat protein At1g13570-like n=1 Tax=Diospyros lotus TaxID=55363 RepID=UPI002255F9F7|nr:F-box/FBD/LRR-repeat protein At1g13570-like [Diospyros lotus]XP_052206471.1 F-box/FBD/LRR-repeat protein At1g13570-like [Diospyros lotus]XP_052206472.1 F-box/FBD/LRR-repeat protein At1g13570-like [Diospyros lotus]XP_052206473.1 F-box/FBD/LRR-repeat protein At1g13570-like [Diospyros lotus]XP_052206474.1 F-box/FBD/LRR-repeat protein At1g13570-like [Diospyros lotus]XP_052206476.1 F-box/FBD/LRR-repeat protein At1g13570-like [Diospyros lotus]
MMGRQQKVAKLTTKKDQLIELPDGVLSTIISMLTLREAVRTSILSKQWRYIWTCHADLWFDSAKVLGNRAYSTSISNCQPESDRILQRLKFVERVDRFMHLRSKGTKIDSLTIHFHLGKDSAPHLDQWISCAITKGVENIDLDLSESCSFKMDYSSSSPLEKYKFPYWLLASTGKNCSVKHLKLASCSLSPRCSCNLTSLTNIQLQGVNISDQQLESLISSCSCLEELSLHQCSDLVSLKFAGPNIQLKLLRVKECFRLQKMELCAENLVLFEYIGNFISFCFKNVPKLAAAFLSFTGEGRLEGGTFALTRFASDLPELVTLNLVLILTMKIIKLPEDAPKFINVKQLVLTIFPFNDDDDLLWISYLLKAFPLLHKLQLNLFCPSFIIPRDNQRNLPGCPHWHLTDLEINGFYGNQHEVELVKYLINNLVELKVLAVGPCQKVYRGCHNWVHHEAASWYKLRKESVRRWLHSVIPPTVHLKIW